MTVLLWPFLLMVAFLAIGTIAVMFGGIVLEKYDHAGASMCFTLAGVVLLGAAFLMGVVAFRYEIVPVNNDVRVGTPKTVQVQNYQPAII